MKKISFLALPFVFLAILFIFFPVSKLFSQIYDGRKLVAFFGHGTETINVGSTSVSQFGTSALKTSLGNRTNRALFSVEDNPVRIWHIGTSGVNSPLVAGEQGILIGTNTSYQIIGYESIKNARFICPNNGTATVNVEYQELKPLN